MPSHSHGSPDHQHGSSHEVADPYAPVYMGLPHERVLRPRFWVALALSLPVLVLAMGEMIWPLFFHRITPRLSGML